MNGSAAAPRVDVDTWVLVLAVPLLFPVWRYFAAPMRMPGPGGENDELWRTVGSFAVFFLLFGLVPLFDQMLRRRGALRSVGLGLGEVRVGLRAVLVGLPLVAGIAWSGVGMPDVRAEYPLCRLLLARHDLLLPYSIAYALLYYVAWEWCFRGWMLHGLAQRWPPMLAILLQTVPSALVHLGKPAGEMFGSIPFGLALGWLSWRTRSIWYGWALHVALGVGTDVLVIHG